MAKWINKVSIKSKGQTTDTVTYDIGTSFDNVYLKNGSNGFFNYTLKNFYDNIVAFFSQPMHMIYRSETPQNDNIMVWYHEENV